ncbi:MAG: non-canonical purine NTP pyrophosphatase [bacterium]|nr:non-canonical purine NTP pyrophosphatase [bacterium]
MEDVVFITGNQNKADYLTKYLGHPVEHIKLELDEIQSLDPKKIVEHKVRQAYDKIKKPVLVEDGSLEFVALGRLPGTFIKFFVEEMSMEAMCSILEGKTRRAIARSTFGYFDGNELRFFEGKLGGEIALAPAGENGWDWDKIFIPEGYTTARAQFNDEDYQKTSMQLRPFAQLKNFLESRN